MRWASERRWAKARSNSSLDVGSDDRDVDWRQLE